MDGVFTVDDKYKVEIFEWLNSNGIDPKSTLLNARRISLPGRLMIHIKDPNYQVMFKLVFGHALSKRTIKISNNALKGRQ